MMSSLVLLFSRSLVWIVVVCCASLLLSCGGKTHVVIAAKQDVKTLTVQGNEYSSQGKYEEAATYYDRARLLAMRVDDRRGVAENLNNLGYLYAIAGDQKAAKEKILAAMAINRDISNDVGLASNLINLGNLFLEEGDYEQALASFVDAEEAAGKQRLLVATALNNRAKALRLMGDYEASQETIDTALPIALKHNEHRLAAACYHNVGALFEAQGNHADAVAAYQQALQEDRLVEYAPGIADDLVSLGRVLLLQGEKAASADSYRRAYQVAVQLGDRRRIKAALYALISIGEPTLSPSELTAFRRTYRELER